MHGTCSMSCLYDIYLSTSAAIPTKLFSSNFARPRQLICNAHCHLNSLPSRRKLPKNLENPRRAKLPPDPGPLRAPAKVEKKKERHTLFGIVQEQDKTENSVIGSDDECVEWSKDELDAISALFDRKMPQKPVLRQKQQPLPLPLPYKTRPSQVPTLKQRNRASSGLRILSRSSFSDRVYKNPEALVSIAREIAELPTEKSVSVVLDKWIRFLRKGSLSMTLRELGHMGLPERALQTLCWAQEQQSRGLFPDDRILASAVEVLARFGQLKIDSEMEKYLGSASRTVMEAMARGFIRSGKLHRARKILLFAKDNKRTLDASIHAKLILQAGKTPDGYKLASALLDELSERENLELMPQDCTAVMKVCIKLGRFDAVESLFSWYKETGRNLTVVMYTTVIYSRYCHKKYREGMLLVWEMEKSDILLDLPAYRVIIRLLVALNDLPRVTKYFSKLKDAGISPTYDVYLDIIKVYAASGRLAKCKQICQEVEKAGLKLDRETISMLSELDRENRL